jgi:prephenate dehydrogenase
MKPEVIAIIGGTGKMGKMFKKLFEKQRYKVIVAGRETKISPKEAVSQADVIIISVPIRNTEETIKEISPYIKGTSLLTDFISVKVNPCKWMLNANCEVIGGHPVFGPLKNVNGQNFVLCPARGSRYLEWYKKTLKKMGLNVLIMSPDEHDKSMAIIQCLNHLSNIAFATSLKALNFNLSNNLVSPNFELRLYPVGRMLSQSEEMYADIETENPYSKEAAKAYFDVVSIMKTMIENKDKSSIENLIREARGYFGDLSKESLELTTKILEGMHKYKNKTWKK